MKSRAESFTGKRIAPDALQDFSGRALRALGLPADCAEASAEVLVTTDTWGVYTHGTRQLLPLSRNLRGGAIRADSRPEIAGRHGGCILVDGRCAMPMVTARVAMEAAIEQARKSGIAYAGVRHSSHFGAAGYYAVMAAEAGMIGIAMSNVDVCMSVPGSRSAVIGTNPIAFAVPSGDKHPVFLDIATSVVAVSKVLAAKASGSPIPENWLIDDRGRQTADAAAYPEHATIVPMAAHKGYGLALLIEILSGVLTGAGVLSQVKCWLSDDADPAGQGHAFLALDVGSMMSGEAFCDRMTALCAELHSAPVADGSDGVVLPGEIEWRRREDALQNGLALPDYVLGNLFELAGELDLTDDLEAAFS